MAATIQQLAVALAPGDAPEPLVRLTSTVPFSAAEANTPTISDLSGSALI
jgi:hypothetical protein